MMQPKSTITLIQSEILSYPSVHHWLADKLALPEHYGHNLDALWDCLTGELALPLSIVWVNDELSEQEGKQADEQNSQAMSFSYNAIISLLEEAAEEVEELSFQYIVNDNA